MKKIKRRAYSALLVAFCLLIGMGVYIYRFSTQSERWVTFSANQTVYADGKLITGTVTDRSGTVLSSVEGGRRVSAADPALRIATIHAVGDAAGNIAPERFPRFPTVSAVTVP